MSLPIVQYHLAPSFDDSQHSLDIRDRIWRDKRIAHIFNPLYIAQEENDSSRSILFFLIADNVVFGLDQCNYTIIVPLLCFVCSALCLLQSYR